MQDKSPKIIAYATGASLAAAILVYVFGPTFFPEYNQDRKSAIRRSPSSGGFVGLLNPANDCFINSVLQTLAGLNDLRIFLEFELDRRRSSCNEEGIISVALKDILDDLNENPLRKKTISAQKFIKSLERVHHKSISRHQQDAQEFFLAVAEKLNDERVNKNEGGRVVGREAWTSTKVNVGINNEGSASNGGDSQKACPLESKPNPQMQDSRGFFSEEEALSQVALEECNYLGKFPFEGELESQVNCLTCHYKSKPTTSTFVSLTLPVPVKSSISLDSCFDSLTKAEYIDDYRCEACRLNYALALKERALLTTRNPETSSSLHADISIIRDALENDLEQIKDNAHLLPVHDAPKRRIVRYTRISRFPQILAVHLSRSIYGAAMSATKNTARISFPIVLPLGGLLQRTTYSLRGIVTHQGGHQSGHYESYRRQSILTNWLDLNKPKTSQTSVGSTDCVLNHSSNTQEASQSMATCRSTVLDSVTQKSVDYVTENIDTDCPKNTAHSNIDLDLSLSGRSLSEIVAPHYAAALDVLGSNEVNIVEKSRREQEKKARNQTVPFSINEQDDRWWHISDDKAWEVQTSEVLAMQKEVYLLFYEQKN